MLDQSILKETELPMTADPPRSIGVIMVLPLSLNHTMDSWREDKRHTFTQGRIGL
jgi:hypothetical protein